MPSCAHTCARLRACARPRRRTHNPSNSVTALQFPGMAHNNNNILLKYNNNNAVTLNRYQGVTACYALNQQNQQFRAFGRAGHPQTSRTVNKNARPALPSNPAKSPAALLPNHTRLLTGRHRPFRPRDGRYFIRLTPPPRVGARLRGVGGCKLQPLPPSSRACYSPTHRATPRLA